MIQEIIMICEKIKEIDIYASNHTYKKSYLMREEGYLVVIGKQTFDKVHQLDLKKLLKRFMRSHYFYKPKFDGPAGVEPATHRRSPSGHPTRSLSAVMLLRISNIPLQ
ncbi:hypothetical protein RF11_13190 [Thelohanellus kitauei]|uniref:Uncharacterized protein n=1 Tax=Thelohanellus kitauei TaxID=669202 RepID=A0A0C2JNJ5_THEKT|nr:hypothetical protein RF11_13190 [Thelohanellus kitauei]